MASPGSIVTLPDGGFAVADVLNRALREVTAAGTIRTIAHLETDGQECRPGLSLGAKRCVDACKPAQIVRSPDGWLFVATPVCGRIFAVALTGQAIAIAGDEPLSPVPYAPRLFMPTGVAVAANGTILMADNHSLLSLPPGGLYKWPLRWPLGRRIFPESLLTVPDDQLLMVEGSGVIVRLSVATGRVLTLLGNPSVRLTRTGKRFWHYDPAIGSPTAIAAMPDGGFVFTDSLTDRVRRVDPAGRISTVAGNGHAGFAGDGGPALEARLDDPSGVAVRNDGGLLIADASNDRVRLVSPVDGTISTVAGGGRPVPEDPAKENSRNYYAQACYDCADDYDRTWNYFYLSGLPLTARSGRPVVVQLVTSLAAQVGVTISRDKQRVKSLRTSVRAGRSEISLGTLAAGRYTVDVSGRSGSNRQHNRATLLVR